MVGLDPFSPCYVLDSFVSLLGDQQLPSLPQNDMLATRIILVKVWYNKSFLTYDRVR